MHVNLQISVTKVCRLQFWRSVPAVVKAGSTLSYEIICCSEFNEPTSQDFTYSVSIRKYVDASRTANYVAENVADVRSTRKVGGITVIKSNAPIVPGCYSISVSVIHESDADGLVILPVHSDMFKVCSIEDYEQSISLACAFIPRLLGCYREFRCVNKTVVVREEYGSTLGSHIYDSSIVLVRYIENNLAFLLTTAECEDNSSNRVVLELGAGCGMVGLYIAALLSRMDDKNDTCARLSSSTKLEEIVSPSDEITVLITDRDQQKSIIEHNIGVNSHLRSPSTHITYVALDWASTVHLEHIVSQLSSNAANLIVAGDVFYDREVAALFFKVIRSLGAHSIHLKVLVAQKLRLNQEKAAVALIGEEEIRTDCGFARVEKVHEEADVILWLLYM